MSAHPRESERVRCPVCALPFGPRPELCWAEGPHGSHCVLPVGHEQFHTYANQPEEGHMGQQTQRQAYFSAEPAKKLYANLSNDDWQPVACPDKRCAQHGASCEPVADPRDATGTANRCPVCFTTVAPIPQRDRTCEGEPDGDSMHNETPDQAAKRVASEEALAARDAEVSPGVYEALPDPEKVGPIRVAQRDPERLP